MKITNTIILMILAFLSLLFVGCGEKERNKIPAGMDFITSAARETSKWWNDEGEYADAEMNATTDADVEADNDSGILARISLAIFGPAPAPEALALEDAVDNLEDAWDAYQKARRKFGKSHTSAETKDVFPMPGAIPDELVALN